MVKPFDETPGIVSVLSGYTGGHVVNPTYEQVCSETTGHVEAVQIVFDDELYSYEQLLAIFWTLIDPTDAGVNFLTVESLTQRPFSIMMRNNVS